MKNKETNRKTIISNVKSWFEKKQYFYKTVCFTGSYKVIGNYKGSKIVDLAVSENTLDRARELNQYIALLCANDIDENILICSGSYGANVTKICEDTYGNKIAFISIY